MGKSLSVLKRKRGDVGPSPMTSEVKFNIYHSLEINLVDYVACPLAMLMNKTLKHGTLPQDWKKAFVSPIHKKGARNIAENYRPISLTSVDCKSMEKFVKDAVFNHLIENNLLSKKQFGFVNGRSTVTQLLNYVDKCAEIIANGGAVDCIYFDFSKAFDTVPHQRLAAKMKAYGISGNVLSWTQDFLAGREQVIRVTVNYQFPNQSPVAFHKVVFSVLYYLSYILMIFPM